MKNNCFDSDHAVTGVVVTILVFGLIVTLLGIIQVVYVPQWMEQREADHMSEVSSQFSQLKHAIDLQVISQSSIMVSHPFSLGSKEMPFLSSSKSFGSLSIIDNDCQVTISGDSSVTFNLGTIRYQSINSYYLNQMYTYENGAVILNQSSGNVLIGNPSFTVNTGTMNISFTIINLTSTGGKNSIEGIGNYHLQTIFLNADDTVNVTNVNTLSISTRFPRAWNISFNRSLFNSGLSYQITNTTDSITITFQEVKPNIFIEHVRIGVQMTPGWIDNS